MNITAFEEKRAKIPAQSTIEEFLNDLHFSIYPKDTFHLSELVDATKDFFNIPYESSQLKLEDFGFNGHGNDGTFLECLVHWGTYRLFEQKKVKKVGPNQWAHISNPLPSYAMPRISQKLVGEAMVSVKLLRSCKFTPERVKEDLKLNWEPAVLSMAIKKVFAMSAEEAIA